MPKQCVITVNQTKLCCLPERPDCLSVRLVMRKQTAGVSAASNQVLKCAVIFSLLNILSLNYFICTLRCLNNAFCNRDMMDYVYFLGEYCNPSRENRETRDAVIASCKTAYVWEL